MQERENVIKCAQMKKYGITASEEFAVAGKTYGYEKEIESDQ